MNSRQARVLEALRRVLRFLNRVGEALEPKLRGKNFTRPKELLEEVVATLDGHAGVQATSVVRSQGETTRQQRLRQILIRDHMVPIARVARAMLPHVPNFSALQVPRGRGSHGERLVNAAVAMAAVASEYLPVFVENGHEPEVVENLLAATMELQDSRGLRSQSRHQRSGATRGLKDEVRRARQAILLLDSVLKPALAPHQHLLTEWEKTKRIGRLGGGVAAGGDGEAGSGGTSGADEPVVEAA